MQTMLHPANSYSLQSTADCRVNKVGNKEAMLISSGYGVFFNRRIKEPKFDGWSCGISSKLWNNSDSTHAEQQINGLVLLGEQERIHQNEVASVFCIYILAFLGESITLIKLLNSRTLRWLKTLLHNDERSWTERNISHTKSTELIAMRRASGGLTTLMRRWCR